MADKRSPAGRRPRAGANVGHREGVPEGEARVSDAALVELAAGLKAVCVAAGLTVATAESCTGGLVARTITRIPGSSGYFIGGIVSYSDAVKVGLLGVPESVLMAHGAVSAQAARSMAQGALSRLGADLAVSVTGIAGPDGGSPAKPVGSTYVATAGPDGTDVRRFNWTGDRSQNVSASVQAALEMLIVHAELVVRGRASAGGPAAGSAGTAETAAGGSTSSRR